MANKCYDHLGQEFDTIIEMCKYWGMSAATFRARIKSGMTLEDALTTKVGMRCKKCKDHLGQEFDTIIEMCKYWGIRCKTFKNRMGKGWTLDRALTEADLGAKKRNRCKDHLGNEFDNAKEMCKYWGIGYNTFIYRMSNRWTLDRALTEAVGNTCVDHIGNNFKSIEDMCKHWGVNVSTFYSRIKSGATIEEVLTLDKKSFSKTCIDHTGRAFESIVDMCRYWGVNRATFDGRIRAGATIEEALTGNIDGVSGVEDHLGNRFNNLEEMCKHYNISKETFNSRIHYGWTLEKALTEPIKTHANACTDHLGNTFSSVSEMVKHYGISSATYLSRRRLGWSLEDALTADRENTDVIEFNAFGERLTRGKAAKKFNSNINTLRSRLKNKMEPEVSLVCTDDLHLEFISLNGKAYYRLKWSEDPVSTREIIEYYRPDLLDAYDKSNPTGEYRPYKRGGEN